MAAWTKTVIEHGIRIRLYGRGGLIYYDVTVGGERTRKSMGYADTPADRKRAEAGAKAMCAELAEMKLTRCRPETITLGEVFRFYRAQGTTALAVVEEAGRRAPGAVRGSMGRGTGRSRPLPDARGPLRGRAPGRDAHALHAEAEDQGGARWHDRGGSAVALDCLQLGTQAQGRRSSASLDESGRGHGEAQGEEPAQAGRQPERYVRTLAHVDAVDPMGRLRTMLTLTRYTGRRESAICGLRAGDVLFTKEQVRRTLAEMGRDESWAERWPHGAIRWQAETDKQGFEEIAPMSKTTREALEVYLRANPRVGEAPLFPAPGDDVAPMRRDTASKWLHRAETLAEVPKLHGGRWHPYRRLWATERKHLSDADVAAAGGWRDTRALKLSYQHADADTMLSVVEAAG